MKRMIAGFAASCFVFCASVVGANVIWTNVGWAQDQKAVPQKAIPLPPVDVSSYDPQLSAKEAALTNWDLAVSGIRVGLIASRNVLATDRNGGSLEELVAQGHFAVKAIITRTGSANWYINAEPDLTPPDGSLLLAAIQTLEQDCADGACEDQRKAILDIFGKLGESFKQAGDQAAKIADSKEAGTEHALMAEILSNMSDYLAGSAWYENLTLTEVGRDGQEVSARLVGALGVWNNLAPYIGLMDKEIDTAIEAAIDHLLRDMRRNTRNKPVLAPDGPEIAALKASSSALAVELKRAAGLF